MIIDIISHKKHSIKKAFRFIYIVLFVASFGGMVGGTWGGQPPLFAMYDAPIWLYIIASIISFFSLILLFESIFSGVPVIGKIYFEDEILKIDVSNNVHELKFDTIKNIEIKRDYLNSQSDSDRKAKRIAIESENGKFIYDILLSDDEEDEILSNVK